MTQTFTTLTLVIIAGLGYSLIALAKLDQDHPNLRAFLSYAAVGLAWGEVSGLGHQESLWVRVWVAESVEVFERISFLHLAFCFSCWALGWSGGWQDWRRRGGGARLWLGRMG